MGRVEELVGRCRSIVEDISFQEPRRWKEEAGDAKVVGHFQAYFPEEIIHAGGMLPLKVAGGGNKMDTRRADSRIAGFTCAICHSSLELGLSGRLSFMDAFIFTSICDLSRNLGGLWVLNFPDTYARILYLPQNLTSEGSIPFLAFQYRQIKEDLEEKVLGRPISEDALRQSIAVYNTNRRLLRQLYDIRRESPWLISTVELYSLMRAGSLMRREEHNRILEEVVAELPRREAKPRDKIRVMLEGPFCEQPPLEFLEVLEEVCYIVDDDLMLGLHWFKEDVKEDGDPYWNLAVAYVVDTDYTLQQHDERPPGRDARFLAKVKRAKAEAVILSPAKFCEPALDEIPIFMKELQKEGV
ncbi:MAG TPA: 2-hydroxyacyl-CoA dehydratase, partial [Dehalococcoidia bacterium]|nr:2-hydroxyacyl-CoA dehydratase [Dehalococcoidia bacterium]